MYELLIFILVLLFCVTMLYVVIYKGQEINYDIVVDGVLYEDVKYSIVDGSIIIKFGDGSKKILSFDEIEVLTEETE